MKEMVLQQKPLEKADFIVKITGPVGQFWQMESARIRNFLNPLSKVEIFESGILCTLSFNELKPENSFRYFTAIVLFITALTTQSCSKESGSHNREGSLITMAVNFVRATSPWRQNKTMIKVNNDTLYLLLLIFFKTFPFTDKVWVLQYSSCEEGPFDKQL